MDLMIDWPRTGLRVQRVHLALVNAIFPPYASTIGLAKQDRGSSAGV
jgi:hypothetical protein